MTPRKTPSRRSSRRRRALWALGAAVVSLAFLLGLWWGGPGPQPPVPPRPTPKAVQAPKAKPTAQPVKQAPQQDATASRPPIPRIALIIDDMGHGLAPATRLAALNLPLTLSILPHAAQAEAVARLARSNNLEVMLHLPMEPRGYPGRDPGPGALLCGMPRDVLLATLRDNLARVPHAAGVNSHMGSEFSLRPELLEPVLLELKKRDLFYLDSFTSPDSQGLATARRLGLRTGRRDVFLDHQVSREAIDRQMERLLNLARKRGRAVAIGHPHPETIKALQYWAPRLRRQATLVKVSEILDAP